MYTVIFSNHDQRHHLPHRRSGQLSLACAVRLSIDSGDVTMAGIWSSMSVRPCITTQFPMIGGRRTQQLAPHGHRDDTAARSRRPASPVLSSSRKAKAHKIVAGDGVDFPGSRYSYYGDLLSILDSSRSGSCKDDAVVAASGEGGGGVVPPLNGGGGGRGEEESGNPGGSGDPLLVWILTKMKPKLQKDPQDLDVAFKMLADYLRLLISTRGEGTALAGLGVDAVADLQEKTGNLPCPSASDDDSSISISGNLQYPSRCDSSTSMSTGTMSPTGVEGGHSSENPVERIAQLEKNQLTTFWGPRTATIVSTVRNPAVNRNKGLLGAFHTIAEKLFIFCGALVMWAFQYPVGANARLSFNDGRMQAIIMGSVILSVTGLFFLAPLASYVKESESVDCIGFKLFKVLLLILLLGLWVELCAILSFCAATSTSIVWPVTIVGAAAILLIWAWVFSVQVPKGNLGSATDSRRAPATLSRAPI